MIPSTTWALEYSGIDGRKRDERVIHFPRCRDEIVRQDRVSEHLRKVLLEMVADERAGITVKW